MSIREKHLAELRATFGPRVTAGLDERRLYSHDVGTMPRLIRPLVGKALADVVVQPRAEPEIVQLVRWASERGVPITPRAKATSGYGDGVPVRGAIVADLSRYRGLVAVDPQAMTVTVRASTVWQDLERGLSQKGLALRLYPSSAPSSTVAGWLAQGGVGYGSYQHGSFRHNVVAARVLLPSGQVRTFEGDDIDLIADAEGTTGIILEVTPRVRPLEEERIVAVAFPPPLLLVCDGRIEERNLRRELISEDELYGFLRELGAEDLSRVKRAYLESDGRISVILRAGAGRGARGRPST